MFNLTFPKYEFRLKKIEEKKFIFDEIRKKYIEFTPEEWVRQNCVKFLIDQKKYFSHLISIEKTIKLNGLTKRFDIIAYDIFGNVDLLVECKAPNIIIDQKSFDQIITYDKVINAKYLMLTNGIINYYCEVNKIDKKINFLKDIPVYK